MPLFAGADQVDDRLVVLPVLYHLLWRQVLAADLGSAPPDRPLWSDGPGDLAGLVDHRVIPAVANTSTGGTGMSTSDEGDR